MPGKAEAPHRHSSSGPTSDANFEPDSLSHGVGESDDDSDDRADDSASHVDEGWRAGHHGKHKPLGLPPPSIQQVKNVFHSLAPPKVSKSMLCMPTCCACPPRPLKPSSENQNASLLMPRITRAQPQNAHRTTYFSVFEDADCMRCSRMLAGRATSLSGVSAFSLCTFFVGVLAHRNC